MEEKLCSPDIVLESVDITEFGDLPQGLYVYKIQCNISGTVVEHLVQVYAKYETNSVLLNWKPVEGVDEYRVYRGRDINCSDGFFVIYDQSYFHDNGLGELNIM